jgi:hypothetical protein
MRRAVTVYWDIRGEQLWHIIDAVAIQVAANRADWMLFIDFEDGNVPRLREQVGE